jgi:uncharacterized membrane protein
MDTFSLAASVAAGCIGGVFFAFTAFVMPALNRLPAPAAIATMQSINVTALRAPLMLALFGTAAVSVLVAVLGIGAWSTPSGPWAVAGASAYLVGVIGVTAAGNVPLNNRLAGMDPDAADAGAGWTRFASPWTRLNSVRTVASLAAAVLFALAAR